MGKFIVDRFSKMCLLLLSYIAKGHTKNTFQTAKSGGFIIFSHFKIFLMRRWLFKQLVVNMNISWAAEGLLVNSDVFDPLQTRKKAYAGSIHTIMTSGLILVTVTAIVDGILEEATVTAIVRTLFIGSFYAIVDDTFPSAGSSLLSGLECCCCIFR